VWKPSVTVAAVIEHRSPLVQKCVEDFLAGRSFPLDVFSPEFS